MRENRYLDNNYHMREKVTYYIYIHTCPNMKCYVGMSISPKNRWNNGEGYKNNKEFYKDIQKYGWNNIEHEILATTNYGWLARCLERQMISRFKNEGLAYNMVNAEKNQERKSKRKIPLKRVGKYNINGELIKEYNSVSEAWKDGNPSPSSIRACCNGKRKTIKGYVWKYLTNFN